jgi:hypothetical protein
MATDAAFGDINLTASRHLRQLRRHITNNQEAIDTEGRQKKYGRKRQFALLVSEHLVMPWKQNDSAGNQYKCGRHMPQVLPHADAER